VAFADDYCGSLVIADTLVATEPSLYVMIGADDDEGTATWLSLSVWGDPEWPDTQAPTLRPTAVPTAVDTASTQVVLWFEADTANDVTADVVASAVASVIDGVDASMVKHFTLLAGGPGGGVGGTNGGTGSAVSSRESFLSTSAVSESPLQANLPSIPQQRMVVESVTAGFTIEASLNVLGLQSPTEFEAKVADSLTESIDDGSLTLSLSSSCGCLLAAERVEVTLIMRTTPSPSHMPSSSGGSSDNDAESSTSSASTSSVGLIVGVCAAFLVCVALGWAGWRRMSYGKGGNRGDTLLGGFGSNSSEYFDFNGGTFSASRNTGLPNPLAGGNHREGSGFGDGSSDNGMAASMDRDKRGFLIGARGPWLAPFSSASRSKDASVELQGLTSSSSSAEATATVASAGSTTVAADANTRTGVAATTQQPKPSSISSGKASSGYGGGPTTAAEAGFMLGEGNGQRQSTNNNTGSNNWASSSRSGSSPSSNLFGNAGVGVKLVGLGTKPKGGYVPPTLDEDDDDDEDRPVVMV